MINAVYYIDSVVSVKEAVGGQGDGVGAKKEVGPRCDCVCPWLRVKMEGVDVEY